MNAIYGMIQNQMQRQRMRRRSSRTRSSGADADIIEPSVVITSARRASSSSMLLPSALRPPSRSRRSRSDGSSQSTTTAPKPFLFEMCKRWAWEVVQHRCQTHPHEAHHSIVDHNGDTALHLALIGNPPVQTIEALLQACPNLARTTNHKRQYPLRVAASYRASSAVLRCIVRRYPEACNLPDHRGSYPLHIMCDYGCTADAVHAILECKEGRLSANKVDAIYKRTPLKILHQRQNLAEFHDMLKLLREVRERQRDLAAELAGINGVGAVHDDNRSMRVLRKQEELDELAQCVADLAEKEYWKKVKALINAAIVYGNTYFHHVSSDAVVDETHELQQDQLTPPRNNADNYTTAHACLFTKHCPSSLLEFALLMCYDDLLQPDHHGNLPIHLAIQLTASSETFTPFFTSKIASDMVRICPDCAFHDDPLRYALQHDHNKYLSWCPVLFQLWVANPVALDAIDDRLWPHLWARLAVRKPDRQQSPDVLRNALYTSIRENPHLFQAGA